MKNSAKLRLKNLLIIHGPNLNLLGEREPEIYGTLTLSQMNTKLKKAAAEKKLSLRIFQSNSEGSIIDSIHKNRRWASGIIINPAAFTHYSYAIRDAIASVQVPTIEVHLSDIHNREEFRRISVLSDVCKAQISGFGYNSYIKAMEALFGR